MTHQRQISRRQLLRGALIGGAGLAAAAAVGCGDGNDSAATQTPITPPQKSGTPSVITTSPEPTLAAPRWGRLPESALKPAARRDHSLVTDGERLYLFGGRASAPLGDLWVYNLTSAQWSEITAAGPPARFGHNAGFDITGGVTVFGGQADGFFNDVWAYSPTSGSWRDASAASGPSPRYGAASSPDALGRLIVSHGFTDTGRFDDTWAYGAGAWGDLSPSAGERPIERCLTRAVIDHSTGAFILFAGQTDSAPFLGDTWKLAGDGPDATWSEVSSDRKPSPRNLFSMVWDDERRRALVFGGQTEGGRTNDVWIIDAVESTWSELQTQGEAPSARSGQDAVWLPGRRSMLVFGGQDADGDQNDLWELAFHG